MLAYPEIDPVAFALGPVKVHWYGLTYLGGLAFAWWLAVRQTRRPGSVLKREQVDDLNASREGLNSNVHFSERWWIAVNWAVNWPVN